MVAEPAGGAHRNPAEMTSLLKHALHDAVREIADLSTDALLERRYQRLRTYGRYTVTEADS